MWGWASGWERAAGRAQGGEQGQGEALERAGAQVPG